MVNSNKMKWFQITSLYLCIFLFLKNLYEPILPSIIFHYPFIDFRYLLFICIQIFWCSIFYQIVYQYIILYVFMHIRLSFTQCIQILIKQFIKYSFFYIILHFFLFFVFFQQIPFYSLFINLIIQCIGFILVLLFKKVWNYSYFFIIFIVLCSHFIV